MSENAWELLIRPLLTDIVLAYVGLVALLFLAKVVWQAVRAAVTIGRREVGTVRVASLRVEPVAQARPARAPRRRPLPVLLRRPKLARAALISRSS